jgi:hypothetical protein
MTRNEKQWTHFSSIDPVRSLRRHRVGLRFAFAFRQDGRPNLLFVHLPPIANRQPLTGMMRSPMMNTGGRMLRSVSLTGRD